MANVLITSEYFGKFDMTAREMLMKAGHIVIDNPYGHKFLSSEEIIPYAENADAFICDLEKITSDVIDAAPQLQIIARRGVGIDSVDCEYARQKNIEVAITKDVVEAPVAELVMGYILHFSRKICIMNEDMHRNIWNKIMNNSVDTKVLGIVGMGKIAMEVARRAVSFGMDILYYDLHKNLDAEANFGAKQVSLDELLAAADFVTIHTTLNKETKGLFNYNTISKMKKNAYLINTARGAIIDEIGLEKAIEEQKIAGAAIDVFDIEPKTDSVLAKLDNVVLTPHTASFTKEIFIKMDIISAQNIIRHFNNKINESGGFK